MAKGTLYLIPTVIAEQSVHKVIPDQVKDELKHIQHFLAENIRTARRYLSSLKLYDSIEALHFDVLDKDTSPELLGQLLQPIQEGHDMGILAEAGCPGVADPGTMAVQYAHQHNIKIVPLVGPSSLLLALLASGMGGQQFAFHGYLPIPAKEAEKAIRELERESTIKKQTQIFIETPYRNNVLFARLTNVLRADTVLCVALDLTGPSEQIRSLTVSQWRKESIEWPKLPAIFLFSA